MSEEIRYATAGMEYLTDRDHVRQRSCMYVGDNTSRGLHQMAHEIVDNSIQEIMAGFAHNINVTINNDGSLTVEDDGRGIPVKIDRNLSEALGREVCTLEAAMTVLRFGGKPARFPYKTSGGLQGVGATVVNFLSEWCKVESRWEGTAYRQFYRRGIPDSPVERIGSTNLHGTSTTFKPDSEIFPSTCFSYELLRRRLEDLAFLNPGSRILVEENTTSQQCVFCFPHGVVEFVERLKTAVNPIGETICVGGENDGIAYDIAIQFSQGNSGNVRSFINNIEIEDGGTHIAGFRSALTCAINNYGRKSGLLKEIVPSGVDIRKGLIAVLALRIPYPQFEGATRTKLGNPEVEGIVSAAVFQRLTAYFEQHPAFASEILHNAILVAESRCAPHE